MPTSFHTGPPIFAYAQQDGAEWKNWGMAKTGRIVSLRAELFSNENSDLDNKNSKRARFSLPLI